MFMDLSRFYPAELSIAHWRPQFDDATTFAEAESVYVAAMQRLNSSNPHKDAAEAGENAWDSGDEEVLYGLREGHLRNDSFVVQALDRRNRLRVDAMMALMSSPYLDESFFASQTFLSLTNLFSERYGPYAAEIAVALFSNASFPLALVNDQDDPEQTRDKLLNLLALHQGREDFTLQGIDLFRGLGVWRRQAGLPPILDQDRNVLRRQGDKGAAYLNLYAVRVAKVTGASFPDMVIHWQSWDLLLIDAYAKAGRGVLPPNPALAAAVASLGLE